MAKKATAKRNRDESRHPEPEREAAGRGRTRLPSATHATRQFSHSRAASEARSTSNRSSASKEGRSRSSGSRDSRRFSSGGSERQPAAKKRAAEVTSSLKTPRSDRNRSPQRVPQAASGSKEQPAARGRTSGDHPNPQKKAKAKKDRPCDIRRNRMQVRQNVGDAYEWLMGCCAHCGGRHKAEDCVRKVDRHGQTDECGFCSGRAHSTSLCFQLHDSRCETCQVMGHFAEIHDKMERDEWIEHFLSYCHIGHLCGLNKDGALYGRFGVGGKSPSKS